MRLEQLPILLGAVMALIGLAIVGDAFVADRGGPPLAERRRRARTERDRVGEGAVGLGVLCMAAALAGRDTWAYGNVAVIAGAILLVTGAFLNLRFIRELVLYSGPARRQPEREPRGTEVARHQAEAAPAATATPANEDVRTDTDADGAEPVEREPGQPRLRIR
ncbi:MAG TPA: hypothetical protein VGE02_04585 [Gemmatimonadales bacterium]